MREKTPNERSGGLALRDVLVIIMALVPIGVTWGVWSTKMTNFEASLLEEKQKVQMLAKENSDTKDEIRKDLNSLLIDLNTHKTQSDIEINNVKDKIKDIMIRLEKHDDKLAGGKR